MKYFLIVLLVVVLVVVGPLLTIWSLNVLFPALAIPYSLETWSAVVILGGLFKAGEKK